MATEFTHEPDAHRYTMHVDGEVVSVLEYLDHGAGTVLHHTVTVPKHRGHGYAAAVFAVSERKDQATIGIARRSVRVL